MLVWVYATKQKEKVNYEKDSQTHEGVSEGVRLCTVI